MYCIVLGTVCPHTRNDDTAALHASQTTDQRTSVRLRGVVFVRDCATLQGARAAAPTPSLFTLHSTSAPSFFTSALRLISITGQRLPLPPTPPSTNLHLPRRLSSRHIASHQLPPPTPSTTDQPSFYDRPTTSQEQEPHRMYVKRVLRKYG